MAISDNQKVDFLWKKVGYGVAKTDQNSIKAAPNEALSSPMLIRGDQIWAYSELIPQVFPADTTLYVEIYDDSANGESAVEAVEDNTSTANRTWKTNLENWIPVEFGAAYQVKVYAAPSGTSNPQTSGTRLFAAGSGNNDEWFFDYKAGILNFIGDNLPTSVNGTNVIYICGGRYIGPTGRIGLVGDGLDSAEVENSVSGLLVGTSEDLTTTTINQVVDTFNKTEYRTAKYIVQIEHDDNAKYHSTELLLTHNNTEVYFTEYASVTTDSDLGLFSASLVGNNVSLLFTPHYTNTSIKSRRININS